MNPRPNWYCMDCKINRHMDKHGRCEVCDSDSIIDLTLSAFNPNNSARDTADDGIEVLVIRAHKRVAEVRSRMLFGYPVPEMLEEVCQ